MLRSTHSRSICAAVVAMMLVIGATEGVAATKKPPATRPATTLPRELATGIPAPKRVRDQVQIQWDTIRAPLALGYGRVWVGAAGGVAVLDPVSMRQVAGVALALPVLSIASSPDGVWILSGGNGYPRLPDDSDLPPYHLTRIDPVTLAVRFDADLSDLGFPSSARANRKIRLAASPGVAWVTFGQMLARIDVATGAVTTSKMPWYILHIASDAGGLWMVTSGGDTPEEAVVHIARDTNEIRVVADLQNGYPWSIASSGDAVWVVEVYIDPAADPRVPLHLVRIDAVTLAVSATPADVIAVVAGDGQVWVKAAHDAVIGQVDTRTGVVFRSFEVGVYGGTSSDGYTSPPFAIGHGRIWSTPGSIQRTTP